MVSRDQTDSADLPGGAAAAEKVAVAAVVDLVVAQVVVVEEGTGMYQTWGAYTRCPLMLEEWVQQGKRIAGKTAAAAADVKAIVGDTAVVLLMLGLGLIPYLLLLLLLAEVSIE